MSTPLGTPAEFEAEMNARADHYDRREDLVARVATLAPADLAALRAHCLTLGAEEEALAAEERATGGETWPTWLVAATILGANARTPDWDERTYSIIAERVVAEITAWLDAR